MTPLLLEIVEGFGAGTQAPVDAVLEVGRDPNAGMALLDPQVSRKHFRLTAREGGAVLEDLGSTNGTFVNDRRVTATRALVTGDTVRVGTTVMALRSPQELAAVPSAAVPVPPITDAGDVLEPVPERELSSVVELPQIPLLRSAQVPPGYVPRDIAVRETLEVSGEGGGEWGEQQLTELLDSRVKHRTSVVAFALLAVVALAVAVYFGAT